MTLAYSIAEMQTPPIWLLHLEKYRAPERRPVGDLFRAGTGKTIIALHRAVHLARHHRDARVLLTTFSKTLANDLDNKLRRLLHNEPLHARTRLLARDQRRAGFRVPR